MAECDVLIVGAGISGLTAGALLADAGRKVLVLGRGTNDRRKGILRDLQGPTNGMHTALSLRGVIYQGCLRKSWQTCSPDVIV